jgi:hypothetical protein
LKDARVSEAAALEIPVHKQNLSVLNASVKRFPLSSQLKEQERHICVRREKSGVPGLMKSLTAFAWRLERKKLAHFSAGKNEGRCGLNPRPATTDVI